MLSDVDEENRRCASKPLPPPLPLSQDDSVPGPNRPIHGIDDDGNNNNNNNNDDDDIMMFTAPSGNENGNGCCCCCCCCYRNPILLFQQQPQQRHHHHQQQQQQQPQHRHLLPQLLESETYQTVYRKWVLLFLALLVVSLSSGLIYGWPALRARLIYETRTSTRTTTRTSTTNTTTTATATAFFTEEQLGLMYTSGAVSTQGGRFFLGLARDRFGTRAIACFSLLALVVGLFGIAAASFRLGNGSGNGNGNGCDDCGDYSNGNNNNNNYDCDDDGGCDNNNGGGDAVAMVWILASLLFAIGLGSGGQLCVQPVAGLFPNHTGIVLSSLSGAFQISGLVFLVLVVSPSSPPPSSPTPTPLWISFSVFGLCILILVILSAILLPKGDSFLLPLNPTATTGASFNEKETGSGADGADGGGSDGADGADGADGLAPEQQQQQQRQQQRSVNNNNNNNNENNDNVNNNTVYENGQKDDTTGVDDGDDDDEESGGIEEQLTPASSSSCSSSSNGAVATSSVPPLPLPPLSPTPLTAWEQIKTPEYVLLCTWFSIVIVPMQYYVGIIGYQLEGLGGGDNNETGVNYTDLFSYLFAGAAVTSPLAGYIADRHGLGIAQGLASLTASLPFLMLAVKDGLPLRAQVVGLVSYGIARLWIFGLYFTNCGKRFGYSNYGTLAGLGLLISSVVSGLLQYPLIKWTTGGRSALVNALCTGFLVLPMAPYFVWLNKRERQEKRDEQNRERQQERQQHQEQEQQQE